MSEEENLFSLNNNGKNETGLTGSLFDLVKKQQHQPSTTTPGSTSNINETNLFNSLLNSAIPINNNLSYGQPGKLTDATVNQNQQQQRFMYPLNNNSGTAHSGSNGVLNSASLVEQQYLLNLFSQSTMDFVNSPENNMLLRMLTQQQAYQNGQASQDLSAAHLSPAQIYNHQQTQTKAGQNSLLLQNSLLAAAAAAGSTTAPSPQSAGSHQHVQSSLNTVQQTGLYPAGFYPNTLTPSSSIQQQSLNSLLLYEQLFSASQNPLFNSTSTTNGHFPPPPNLANQMIPTLNHHHQQNLGYLYSSMQMFQQSNYFLTNVAYMNEKGQLLDTLPICRDFKSGKCHRGTECRYVHLVNDSVEVNQGRVTVCRDAAKGRCIRQPCKYFHIPLAAINASRSLALVNSQQHQQFFHTTPSPIGLRTSSNLMKSSSSLGGD